MKIVWVFVMGLVLASCKSEQQKAEDAALAPFLKAAAGGDADAQFELYKLYTNGDAVEKDPEEAAKWCLMAAEQDHPGALGWAYHLYDEGRGVPRDQEKALEWILKAEAVKQSYMLRRWIAERYARGAGTDQDYGEAIRWYEKAFELHDSTASYRIAELYNDVEGDSYDREKAHEWFKMAVGDGQSGAASYLAKAHFEGAGVEKDPELAYAWLILARGAYPRAMEKELRTMKLLLEEILSEEQEEAAMKRAEELMAECREGVRAWKKAASGKSGE